MRWTKRPFLGSLGEIARATVFPQDLASSKRRFLLIYLIRLFFLVGRRLWRDRCPRQAAALAFQTFLSMVPLLAVALAVASTLELDWYEEKLVTFFETQLIPEAAADVGHRIAELVTAIKPQTLGLLGGASLVIMSLTLLFTVEQVTNEIFRCERRRRFWMRLATSLVLLLVAPLAYGLSLYYTGKLFSLPRAATAALPPLFTILTLFLCYWRLPHTKILIRHSLISAVTAGVMLEIVKLGFALYARHLGATLSYVYGTVAILPLFMIWVYLAWLIFLFGAELNAALHEVKRHDRFLE